VSETYTENFEKQKKVMYWDSNQQSCTLLSSACNSHGKQLCTSET